MRNPLTFRKRAKRDVVCLGRIGMDLNPEMFDAPMEDSASFVRSLGGSPGNIAVGCARLGLKTGFIGRLAPDAIGRYLRGILKREGIDTGGVVMDDSGALTGLAFTEVKSPEQCGVVMYRENAVDLKLCPADISGKYIGDTRVLQISGTALSRSPSREATLLAMELARRTGTRVVLDLDYRPYSWGGPQESALYLALACSLSDVVIGNREEIDVMGAVYPECRGTDAVAARFLLQRGARIVIIKHGARGSVAFPAAGSPVKAGIFKIRARKTFGAGDAYAAGLIYGLLGGKDLKTCMELGSAGAALNVSGTDCSRAMATREQLHTFIRERKGVRA
ncbi:MAG: 5-dehydro-2-deoxygluconokinase [Verrucomicrobiae bacterium]|nr:5-dehydro-2-deoxygluconokinase [Verrucomicrobiae bacterium]